MTVRYLHQPTSVLLRVLVDGNRTLNALRLIRPPVAVSLKTPNRTLTNAWRLIACESSQHADAVASFVSPFPVNAMLHLQSESTGRWLQQVDASLDEMLIDHAHCERKAASTAMNLLNAYTDDRELGREMIRIIEEELEHYEMVLQLLERRGIPFRRLASGPYGRKLNALVRSQEPERAIDRLLVASLIEARSCERFRLLADHVRGQDEELADFYAGLFESEARHHTTYVRLAERFADRTTVAKRLTQLSAKEAEILADGSELPRMHS